MIAAALFCGLGLNKITFLWYIAAVMAAAAVLYRSLAAKNIVNPRDLLCALPGFCVGGFLMIFYNLRNGFATVRYMLSRLVHPTRLGVDNLTYVANLKIRFGHLTRAMISGRDIGMGTGRQEILSPNVPVFVVSLLLLFLMAKKVNPSKKKKIVFLAVCLVVLLACSPITVSGLALNHLYVLFFLPPVLISVALVSLQEALPCKKAAVCLAGIPIALILASNIAVARRDILYLRATGGTTPYATAINGLASWLDANRIKEFVIVNSIAPSIEFLTGGRVGSLIERQVYDHQGFMGRFNDLLASGVCGVDFYFVLGQKVAKSNEGYYGEEFEELLSLAKGRRLNCRVVKIIEDKSGQPEYVVWKIFRDAPGRLAGAGRPAGAVCRRQAHAAFKAVATRSIAALSRPS